jgi:RNA polymerase sigma factor (sigma-70 family)
VADPEIAGTAAEDALVGVLESVLARLPAEQREVIELAVGAQMKYAQIAERTGVSGLVVQRRLNRGLMAIRYSLQESQRFNQARQLESDRL